ncbi:hypothetical protein BKL48_12445 [Bacillus cereus]|nr:hypothetical protein BKL48_12445 [Bacillus cereus]GCF82078.1 hypothetical protein BCACH14_40540 [Bacillus cereus]
MNNNKEFYLYCNADLQEEPIPKQSQKAYGATHFTRKIGIIKHPQTLPYKYTLMTTLYIN